MTIHLETGSTLSHLTGRSVRQHPVESVTLPLFAAKGRVMGAVHWFQKCVLPRALRSSGWEASQGGQKSPGIWHLWYLNCLEKELVPEWFVKGDQLVTLWWKIWIKRKVTCFGNTASESEFTEKSNFLCRTSWGVLLVLVLSRNAERG